MHILILTTPETAQQITSKHVAMITGAFPGAIVTISDNPSADVREQVEIIIPLLSLDNVNKQLFPRLAWIHTMTAGINGLSDEILESNIIVTNSSGVHPIPIAEQIFTYLLLFARGMHLTIRKQVEKKWDKESVKTFELEGKTIGIIGLGRIGEKTAQIAQGMGMRVLAVKTRVTKEKYADEVYTLKDLDTVLKQSDFIVNCLPGTEETDHLFSMKQFQLMKPTSYFVNIGRGMSVNEKDLITALQQNIIAGAGLDVFEVEPLPVSSPLWDMENVIITPHSAGRTPYYFDRVIAIFCENLKAYLAHKKLPNEVDKKKGY